MPRRPEWWPAALWPAGTSEKARSGPPSDRLPRGIERTSPDPLDSFLETLRLAFGAGRVALFRLDRERERWLLEREVLDEETASAAGREFPTAGHPLTWCLREELVVQVETEELLGRSEGAGWSLAGPVPGRDRSLLVTFAGPPPTSARRALRAALAHLRALLVEGNRGGQGTGRA